MTKVVAIDCWNQELVAMTEVAGSGAKRANDAASVVAADDVAVGTVVAGGVAMILVRTFRPGSQAAIVEAKSLARDRDSSRPCWVDRTFGAGWHRDRVNRRTFANAVWPVRQRPWRLGRRAATGRHRCRNGMACSCAVRGGGRRLDLCKCKRKGEFV